MVSNCYCRVGHIEVYGSRIGINGEPNVWTIANGFFGIMEGCMHTELIKAKLFEQSETYQALKSGVTSLVQYSGYYDERWGTGK